SGADVGRSGSLRTAGAPARRHVPGKLRTFQRHGEPGDRGGRSRLTRGLQTQAHTDKAAGVNPRPPALFVCLSCRAGASVAVVARRVSSCVFVGRVGCISSVAAVTAAVYLLE